MEPSIKNDFVHLRNHSEYSFPDGMSNITEMVAKAKELGMKHLAITDTGTMFGALHFYRECMANDINPIIGCEFYLDLGKKNKTLLILMAKNYQGYRNLMILSSQACTKGFHYKPIINDELLKQFSSELICISSCIKEVTPCKLFDNEIIEIKKLSEYYYSIFGKENFYLELQDHGSPEQKLLNKQLINLSKETAIPLVATNDIHYLEKEDAKARDILFSIRAKIKKSSIILSKFSNGEYYMKTKEEMYSLFKNIPEALANSVKIA